MSTFIINLNDTIAMSDSAMVELVKVIGTCQPCVREAETNWQDVAIVVFICLAVVIVALIAKQAVLSWKNADIKAAKEEREAKESDADVAKRKQESDLLNKRIEILKELCYEIKEVPQEKNSMEENSNEKNPKVTKTEKRLKHSDSDEVKAYLKALGHIFEKESKGTD